MLIKISSRDPERLGNEEGFRENACAFLGKGNNINLQMDCGLVVTEVGMMR